MGEKQALRNAAAVALLFAVNKVLRNMARKQKSALSPASRKSRRVDDVLPALPPLGPLEEEWRTALAAGLTTEAYSIFNRLGHRTLAAFAGLAPLRLLVNHPRMRANYQFLVSYFIGQMLVDYLPLLKKNPMLVMLLSTAQLLSWWVFSDTALPRDYINFLYSQGKIDPARIRYCREVIFSGRKYKDLRVICFPKAEGGTWGCENPSDIPRCTAQYFLHHMTGSVPFYVKIYLARLIIVLVSGRSKAQLATEVFPFFNDVLRSSTFLSMYCTLAYLALSITTVIFAERAANPFVIWGMLMIPGLALLVETPSQKRTIASYCSTFGVHPILCALPNQVLFDVGAAGVALASSRRVVRKPLLLNLLWPDDSTKTPSK